MNPQGGAQRHDSSSRAATGPRPGKESRSDLPKQPCLSTQSIRRDARDTADNSSNARDPTPGDRRERRSGISMSSKRARPKQVSEATGGRGEGRETWRREDGRERNQRTEMQKSRRRKTFSLLSSLLESLFAVCTRALSLSRTRTGCCCFSVATTTGTGSGKGREKKGLSNFGGGGWPATKLKIEWIGGPSGAQRTGTGRRGGGRRRLTALRKRATLLEILNGGRLAGGCAFGNFGPVPSATVRFLAPAGMLGAPVDGSPPSTDGRPPEGIFALSRQILAQISLDHQSSAPQSRQSPARQNQPRDVYHSPLCKQKTGCPPAGNQTAVRRFDPRPRRGSKKRGIRRCTWHRKADFSRATSELAQSSPSFRLSSHAKRRRRHRT